MMVERGGGMNGVRTDGTAGVFDMMWFAVATGYGNAEQMAAVVVAESQDFWAQVAQQLGYQVQAA